MNVGTLFDEPESVDKKARQPRIKPTTKASALQTDLLKSSLQLCSLKRHRII